MSILIFILVLAILIIVHEYGHFIVAKKSGIRVDEFGLGYPPRAKVLFKRKGTIFTLNWIPFGGFVKIFGETPDEESISGEDKSRALIHKPKFVQAMVMFAGPLFNFLLAWLFILVALFIGLPASVSESMNEKYILESKVVISEVLAESPASTAGIAIGDVIKEVSVGDTSYQDLGANDIKNLISQNKEVQFLIDRKGEKITTTAKVEEFLIEGKPGIGIGLEEVGIYKPPFFVAIVESFRITGVMIAQIAVGLGGLIVDAFSGTADVSTLTGPVGIVSLVGDASALGFVYLLTFVAMISINLGMINLVPFPALDGGRILFLIIEKIKGSRISPVVANSLNSIGFLILITLMVVITFKDVINLF